MVLNPGSIWTVPGMQRLTDNMNHGYSYDYSYYGVGDRGGAPRERDIKNAEGSLRNNDSKFKVLLTSSGQMYNDITPDLRKKLSTYTGDLLLIEHSAGSLTSQAYMKRINRKNELLAQSAEQLASISDWLGGAAYPFEKLNNSWNLLLGSQFHDLLPGTAIPKAFEYAWNDEFIAANGFSEVLKNSMRTVSSELNTQCLGRSVVVYNPVAQDREDIVTAELIYSKIPENIKVLDKNGKELPSQIIEHNGDSIKFIFMARVPSLGLAVFDVRETNEKSLMDKSLVITSRTLDNEYYKIKIGENGDIISVFDKKASKELLSRPACLEFLFEHPTDYPSWNMDWKDRQNPQVDYLNNNTTISIIERGPVRIALEIDREGRNSKISQVVSLAAGVAGKHLEIANKIDWQSKEVSLKAAFPLTVSNENATYSYGVGTVERNNNSSVKYEVPSKEWFDLTDKSGSYGVSILEDCKFGSDKPNDNILRLTLLYTPKADAAHNFFSFQGTQDWGKHDIRYAIYGHTGDWRTGHSPLQAKFFNQPLLAFESSKHIGPYGREYSFLKLNTPQVGLMAFKKMEEGDYFLVRVNELYGKDATGLNITFPGKIADAYEVNGQEQKIGLANFRNNKLNFDLTHYTIKSFAVKFQPSSSSVKQINQVEVELPYNRDVFSFDDNRDDGSFNNEFSYPAELIPAEIVSEDIRFKTGNTEDGQKNAVACKSQIINLPVGDYNKVYILAAANEDIHDTLMIDEQPFKWNIQNASGFIGQFYNREFAQDMSIVTNIKNPFVKRDNIAWYASHKHIAYPSKNDAYKYCYIFKYEISLPKGAHKLILPENEKIKVFAITVAKIDYDVDPLQPLYDDFKSNQPVVQLR